jgi:MFS family permease
VTRDDTPRPAVARSLASSVYLPTFFFEIGIGAIYPILALSAVHLGASAAVASAAVGAYAMGRVGGSAFGGVFAARWGSPKAALVGMAWTAGAALVCAASGALPAFIVGALLVGMGHALVHVSRQSQVVERVSFHYRARALTTLAGIWRIANFIGPLLGAVAIHRYGLRGAFIFAAVAMASGGVALAATGSWRDHAHAPATRQVGPPRVARENRRILSTLGLAVGLTGAVRAARLAALPLWAAHLGLADGTVSVIFAVSAAVDMTLFLPAGYVMDRRDRRWTALPSTLLLALGILALPLTSGVGGLTVVAIVIGVGNGWGSGLLMTLGSDVSPAEGRHVFLGLWMMLQDVGGLAGPAIISIGAIASLPVGIVAVGAIGVAATGLLARWIPPWRLSDGARAPALD